MTGKKIVQRGKVDPITGEVTLEFLLDGKVCSLVPLNSPVARRYASYIQIRDDLRDVKCWLQSVNTLVNEWEGAAGTLPKSGRNFFSASERCMPSSVKALWFGAIVLYAKSFTEASGRRVKLEHKSVGAAYFDKHDSVMNLRHNLVAHAGVTAYENIQAVVVLPPSSNVNQVWIEVIGSRFEYEDDRGDEVPFLRLVEQVYGNTSRQIDALWKRLLEQEVAPLGKKYWYEKATASVKANIDEE